LPIKLSQSNGTLSEIRGIPRKEHDDKKAIVLNKLNFQRKQIFLRILILIIFEVSVNNN
jgi:hypothetical protein